MYGEMTRTDKESQKGRGWWINVPQPTSPVLANHPIVLYLRKVSGYSGAGFGCLFCYVDRNNNYGLFVTANGGYRITKNVEGTVSAIVDWTGSAYLNTEPGETNKIAISQPSPGVLSFQFNDQPAITCSDSAFTAGGLCFYGAVSTNEDFPSVPLDIRFKLVSPEEYPTAVRYAAYSTTRAALDAISLNDASQERMDVGLYPALYSGTVLTKLGESISGATSSFLASISADTLLIVVPKGVDNFVRIDAIEILTPAGSTLGYFGRGYDGTVLIPLDMSSANVRNRENASGLPDDIYAEFGISADSGRIDCAYGFIYFNSMIATIPPEITSGLTSVQVKIHCAE